MEEINLAARRMSVAPTRASANVPTRSGFVTCPSASAAGGAGGGLGGGGRHSTVFWPRANNSYASTMAAAVGGGGICSPPPGRSESRRGAGDVDVERRALVCAAAAYAC